jgi:hypothetical protein
MGDGSAELEGHSPLEISRFTQKDSSDIHSLELHFIPLEEVIKY